MLKTIWKFNLLLFCFLLEDLKFTCGDSGLFPSPPTTFLMSVQSPLPLPAATLPVAPINTSSSQEAKIASNKGSCQWQVWGWVGNVWQPRIQILFAWQIRLLAPWDIIQQRNKLPPNLNCEHIVFCLFHMPKRRQCLLHIGLQAPVHSLGAAGRLVLPFSKIANCIRFYFSGYLKCQALLKHVIKFCFSCHFMQRCTIQYRKTAISWSQRLGANLHIQYNWAVEESQYCSRRSPVPSSGIGIYVFRVCVFHLQSTASWVS